ncbi:MAG: hypothetical protein IJP13_06695 [Lachnospiraceae bacterium]|nr:hypothetical protein [Lachnospiraceae bacterium]
MRKKWFINVGLTVAISTICLFGCSRDESTDSETSTFDQESYAGETATGEERTTELPTSVGSFDPSDVCKNISINGKIVEFPWTLNKLGDEYTYGKISNVQEGDNICGGYIQRNETNYILVGIGEEEINRDSPIVVVTFSIDDDISLYDLGRGASIDDVANKLGKPDEISNDGVFLHYTYLCDEMKLDFKFYENCLSATHINIFGDWK